MVHIYFARMTTRQVGRRDPAGDSGSSVGNKSGTVKAAAAAAKVAKRRAERQNLRDSRLLRESKMKEQLGLEPA